MSKAIYVAATCFQLITDLNIRCNMQGPAGDLIINAESVPDAHDLAERLKKYNIFDNIFIFKGYDSSFKSVFNGKNTIYSYLKLVVSKHWGKVNLNDFLEGKKEINLSDYEEGFCFNKRYCDIFRAYGIKINIIDEGLGSYLKTYIKDIKDINKFYLYVPCLADYYTEYKDRIIKVVAIDSKKMQFKNLLNNIFNYKNIYIDDNAIVFLDQPYLQRPRLLKRVSSFIPKINKIRYANRYWIEEDKLTFTCNVIKSLAKEETVYLKPHPRDKKYQLELYKKLQIDLFSSTTVPWEIILLNISEKNIALLSFDSTATLSLAMYFNGIDIKYKSFLLYRLYFESRGLPTPDRYKRLDNIVEKLKLKSKKVFLIRNNEELINIINSKVGRLEK